MEKYIKLKEVLTSLGIIYDTTRENKLLIATDIVKDNVRLGKYNSYEDYVTAFRMEVEEALNDPEFNWVEVARETAFVESMPDNPNWPYNTNEGVIHEFKAIMSEFLYPERKIAQEDIRFIPRIVVFLLLEAAEQVEWVYYAAILRQLRTMKAQWQFLELYHLEGLFDYRNILQFKINSFPSENNALKLDKNAIDYDKSIHYIQNEPEGYNNPYEGWPPFQNDPSAPYYLKYDKRAWLNIVQ